MSMVTIACPVGISSSSTRHDAGQLCRSGTYCASACCSGTMAALSLPVLGLLTMLLTRLLNACHHFPGFVYEGARLCEATQSIEIDVRPRKGSKPICSCCHQPARGYDSLTQRRFEFIPVWGFAVFLLYTMRRVDCRACGVKVEALPWANGKHTLTRAYMIFLAQWARKLS